MTSNILTAERLRELFRYDQWAGVFTRLVSASSNAKAGDVAGCIRKDGYRLLRVDGFQYREHRLVWLYVHGTFPANQIDHINGIPSDNRLRNLREATCKENGQNRRRANSNNSSGLLGAHWNGSSGKWSATICINGKRHDLGRFATAEEAHNEYLRVKQECHDFYVHGPHPESERTLIRS